MRRVCDHYAGPAAFSAVASESFDARRVFPRLIVSSIQFSSQRMNKKISARDFSPDSLRGEFS